MSVIAIRGQCACIHTQPSDRRKESLISSSMPSIRWTGIPGGAGSGRFHRASKFPSPSMWPFLLAPRRVPGAMRPRTTTHRQPGTCPPLNAMARSELFDHLDGGFFATEGADSLPPGAAPSARRVNRPRLSVARVLIEIMGVQSIMRWILALKERRNYNIHETHTGLENTPGILCKCVPSQ